MPRASLPPLSRHRGLRPRFFYPPSRPTDQPPGTNGTLVHTSMSSPPTASENRQWITKCGFESSKNPCSASPSLFRSVPPLIPSPLILLGADDDEEDCPPP